MIRQGKIVVNGLQEPRKAEGFFSSSISMSEWITTMNRVFLQVKLLKKNYCKKNIVILCCEKIWKK